VKPTCNVYASSMSRPAPLPPPPGARHRAGHFGPDPLGRSPFPAGAGQEHSP
jgi:hypothetical protein